MRRDGTVVRVAGETALLSCVLRTCAGCSGAHCSVRTREVAARVPQALQLSPGDRVEYELSLPRALGGAFLLFGALPLLFLTGFLALRGVVPAAAEPLAALAGLGAVAAGLGVLYRSAGRYPRDPSELPLIVRKLPASGSQTEE